jgi:Chaperone of endosialidase
MKKLILLSFLLFSLCFETVAQNLGINVLAPEYPLDLKGRMRIQALENVSDGSAGIFFNKSDNSALAAFVGMRNDTLTGFYSKFLNRFVLSLNINSGSLAMGDGTIASGQAATAMGYFTTASGVASFATGENPIAGGRNAVAMGDHSSASAQASTAMGYYTTASGIASFAAGENTTASGRNALALGNNTIAQSYGALAIGRFNNDLGSSTNWVDTDPVLMVGNGINSVNRNNIFTVLKNGSTSIGLGTPTEMLDVNGRVKIRSIGGSIGTAGVWMANDAGNAFGTNGAFFGLNNSTPGSEIAGIFIGGTWKMTMAGTTGNTVLSGNITATAFVNSSDIRYKKNIQALENPINNLLKINGVRYDWRVSEFPEKQFSEKNQIGFIAQELEKVYPEMVFTDEKGFKSVDYARLTPVLVEAVKDLVLKNEALKNQHEKSVSRLDELEKKMVKLEASLVKNNQ